MSNLEPTRVLDLGSFKRVAFFGGIYSNHLALRSAIDRAQALNVDATFALGDFGAFGPHPDRSVELLRDAAIPAIQGNYEESLSSQALHCHCGYTDPQDNRFAQLSYDYTRENTAPEHKAWMGTLSLQGRLMLGTTRVLLCHGSPRRINEFLWRSTTSTAFIEKLLRDCETDIIVCTHTGIHWSRMVGPSRGIVNVGALGRPANDGKTHVWFATIEQAQGDMVTAFVPVEYNHEALAAEMESERLPPEFVETIRTGYWTTCLEILPAKERAAGKW